MVQKFVESQPSLTMMQSRSQPWLRQSSQPLLLEAQHVAWPSMNSSSQPCPQDIQMQLARLVVGNLGLASQLPNWQLGLAVQNSNTAASQLSGLAISRASPSCQKAPIHGSPGELRGLVHISSSMLLGYASGSCFLVYVYGYQMACIKLTSKYVQSIEEKTENTWFLTKKMHSSSVCLLEKHMMHCKCKQIMRIQQNRLGFCRRKNLELRRLSMHDQPAHSRLAIHGEAEFKQHEN